MDRASARFRFCRVHRALLSEFGPQFMPPRLKESEALHEIEAIIDVCCGGALTTTDSKLLLYVRLSFSVRVCNGMWYKTRYGFAKRNGLTTIYGFPRETDLQ